jgi:hypothetical protein
MQKQLEKGRLERNQRTKAYKYRGSKRPDEDDMSSRYDWHGHRPGSSFDAM